MNIYRPHDTPFPTEEEVITPDDWAQIIADALIANERKQAQIAAQCRRLRRERNRDAKRRHAAKREAR